jgi:hypothetical protein
MPKRTINSPGTSQTTTPAKTARFQSPVKSSPTSKVRIVKIDVVSVNGNRISEDLPIKTLIELWKSLDTEIAIEGCSSHRRPGGAIRVNYCLKELICLGEIHPEPEFVFERTTTLRTDAFQCKIVGLNDVRAPKVGETVIVCITRTHFAVPLEIIEEWIAKFGTIVTKPRLVTPTIHLNPSPKLKLVSLGSRGIAIAC